MKVKINFLLTLTCVFFSCYTYDVDVVDKTKWKYSGNVIQNNIDAKETVFDFVSDDRVIIYEDGEITDEVSYLFLVIKREGIIEKYDIRFERDGDDKLNVKYRDNKFIFKKIN